MYKLLCPTDFSDHSKKAIAYAIDLANILNAELHIVTAFTEYKHGGSFKSIKKYIVERNEKELDELKSEFEAKTEMKQPIKFAVVEGHITDVINYYVKSMKIDCIVMGTQGARSMSNRLFGSVTDKIVRQSKIPVIAVPIQAKLNKKPSNLLFAVDSKAIYENTGFDLVNSICDALAIKVDLLHVHTPGESEDFPFDPFISNYLSGNIDKIIFEDSGDSITTNDNQIYKRDTELLIMLRREHSLLNRFLFKSNTDRGLAESNVPMMIIPEQ